MHLKRKTAYRKGIDTENKCKNFLERNGFEILEERFKTRKGEVDIIAKSGEYLVFAEVKGRKTVDEALESVSDRQKKRIVDAAKIFLSENEEYNNYCLRFDLMACSDNEIYHLENCWYEC